MVGNWGYTDVCIDSSQLFPDLQAQCPGSTFSNLSGTQQGGVDFDATTVHRNVHLHLAGTMTLAGQCTLAGCAAIQQTLSHGFTSISCTGTTSCDCAFVYDFVNTDNAAYTAVGTRITTDPGTNAERDYDYCVSGNTLNYREVTAQPAEQGLSTLQR